MGLMALKGNVTLSVAHSKTSPPQLEYDTDLQQTRDGDHTTGTLVCGGWKPPALLLALVAA